MDGLFAHNKKRFASKYVRTIYGKHEASCYDFYANLVAFRLKCVFDKATLYENNRVSKLISL